MKKNVALAGKKGWPLRNGQHRGFATEYPTMIQIITRTDTHPGVIRSVSPSQQVLVDFLMDKAIPENPEGFTLDPRTLGCPSFDGDTYIVSLQGHEKRCSPTPSRFEVVWWVERNYKALMVPGHYLGAWLNHAVAALVFDVSVPIEGLWPAKLFGLKNGQESIYHPDSRKTIYLQPRPVVLPERVVAA